MQLNFTAKRDDNYQLWNDTSVALIFTRLMTKKNHPFNEDKLTYDKFLSEYNLLKGFIEWHNGGFYRSSSPLYHFTQGNMREIFDKIDFETDNEEELLELWKTKVRAGRAN